MVGKASVQKVKGTYRGYLYVKFYIQWCDPLYINDDALAFSSGFLDWPRKKSQNYMKITTFFSRINITIYELGYKCMLSLHNLLVRNVA